MKYLKAVNYSPKKFHHRCLKGTYMPLSCDLRTELQWLRSNQQWYSVKKCFEKFHKIHRKTPVPESLF